MPNFAKLGRTMFSKMIAMAPDNGAVTVTFRLITPGDYDPEAGAATETVVTKTTQAFVFRDKEQETKTGGLTRGTYVVTLADGVLPRRPQEQDEVSFDSAPYDGAVFKVSAVALDAMQVKLDVTVQA